MLYVGSWYGYELYLEPIEEDPDDNIKFFNTSTAVSLLLELRNYYRTFEVSVASRDEIERMNKYLKK